MTFSDRPGQEHDVTMTTEPELAQSFEKFVKQDSPMSAEEAIRVLAQFHNTTPEAVQSAFPNLTKDFDGTVVFSNSNASDISPVVMTGYDSSRNCRWNHLINSVTGQPLNRAH